MKLGLFKRLSREDLGSGTDIPDWVDTLLGVLNQNLEPLNVALTGKLTFSDNFFSTTTSQIFTHGVQLIVNPLKSTSRAIGIIPISVADGYSIDSYASVVQSNGSVGVTLRFLNASGAAASAGTQKKCTVLILFG